MPPSLADAIRIHAVRAPLPRGQEGETLTLDAVKKLSGEFNLPGYSVEAEALRNNIFPLRYLRNMDGITSTDQINLLESSIAQVGLGGLGGNLFEMFIRVGIGRIRAADGDNFEESNLNRQALSSPDNLKLPKANAAFERAKAINTSVVVDARNDFLDERTLPDFLHGCDVAVDALGGLTTRLALQQASTQEGIPLVTGALAGWTGYVGVVHPGNPGPADIMGQDNAAEEILGCPAPAVTLIASLMASETINLLTTPSPTDAPSMLVIDLKSLSFENISI